MVHKLLSAALKLNSHLFSFTFHAQNITFHSFFHIKDVKLCSKQNEKSEKVVSGIGKIVPNFGLFSLYYSPAQKR